MDQLESRTYDTSELSQLAELAKDYSKIINKGQTVYLLGDLGAGKTAFTKLFIHHLGYAGNVTSPTYALLQDYNTPKALVIHSDLYRLSDPEEIYEIGLLDYIEDNQSIVLIEWPEKGEGVLPKADYVFLFSMQGNQRSVKINHSLVNHPLKSCS